MSEKEVLLYACAMLAGMILGFLLWVASGFYNAYRTWRYRNQPFDLWKGMRE